MMPPHFGANDADDTALIYAAMPRHAICCAMMTRSRARVDGYAIVDYDFADASAAMLLAMRKER